MYNLAISASIHIEVDIFCPYVSDLRISLESANNINEDASLFTVLSETSLGGLPEIEYHVRPLPLESIKV